MKVVNHTGKKYKLVSEPTLIGIKLAFLVESKKTIYVSPAVYTLSETDQEILRKHLRILRMPLISSNNSKKASDKYPSLKAWVDDLKLTGADIYCATQKI